MMEAPTRVLFVTVNYHRASDTRAFVESVSRLTGFRWCRVVVVDNEPSPRDRSELQGLVEAYGDAVQILPSERNRFYWGGAAWALRVLYGGWEPLPEWMIICNNDVLIEQEDFVERLLSIDGSNAPVVAPSIVDLDGLEQNPLLLHRPGLRQRLYWWISYRHYSAARLIHGLRKLVLPLRYRARRRKERRRGPIYAPHGAFICLARAFFEAGGYLDENFELFGEELTLAETARWLDLPVIYEPELRIAHLENGMTGKPLTSFSYDHQRRAWQYFRRTYLRGQAPLLPTKGIS